MPRTANSINLVDDHDFCLFDFLGISLRYEIPTTIFHPLDFYIV